MGLKEGFKNYIFGVGVGAHWWGLHIQNLDKYQTMNIQGVEG
jgi:hypothetical protein